MIFNTLFKGAGTGRLPLTLTFCLCGWLAPQSNGVAEDLNLATAIDLTLRQHPDLRIFAVKQQQLQGSRQSAALKPALQLEIEIENFAGSDNFQSFNSAETTVALSSAIELGDQRENRVAAVDARQRSLQVGQQVRALQLMAETTRRFVALLAAQAHEQLAAEAETLSRNALQAVRRRVTEGASPRAEALRAEATLNQSRLATGEAGSKVETAKWHLLEMWAGDTADFERASGDLLQLPEPQAPQQFIDRLQRNAHIQRLAGEVALRQMELNLARANGATDIEWRVGVKQFQADNDSALVAGVNVPLFNGRRNRGDILTAQANLTEAQAQQQASRLQLRTQLLTLMTANRNDYEKVRELRETVIPLLQQAQAETESAYQNGLYGYLELVAARQELISAQKNLINTAASALYLQADIEQLTAEPLVLPSYSTDLPEASQ